MNRHDSTYQARLFRGWEFVSLRYEIDGDFIVVHEKRTLRPVTEKKVPIAGLDPDARHVWSRQKAHWASIVVLLILLIILGYNLLAREGGLSGGKIDWRIWGPTVALGALTWLIMYATRKPREWTHFPSTGGTPGLYVLKQPKTAAAHKAFIEKIRRRAERRQENE